MAKLLQDAADLLEGPRERSPDDDEQRDRQFLGHECIFVDEYQDINEQQYLLVSPMAGWRLIDPDAKLRIMAVADDAQHVYSFKGARVEFIRRFQAEYESALTYRVETLRSSQNIIAEAN